MGDAETCIAFVFFELRYLAKATLDRARTDSDACAFGYVFGLVAAISQLQGQARLQGLDLESLTMADYDPYVDILGLKPLTPPKP